MKNIFTNPQEGRLRAGWRILFFLVLFWIGAATVFVVKPLFGDISKRAFLADYSLLIVALLALAASVAAPLARKYLDKKSFVSLGLKLDKHTGRDLLFGFGLSAAMAALFYLASISIGLVEYQGINFHAYTSGESFNFAEFMKVLSWGSLLLLLLEHVLVGYWEELFFRGYLLQNMAEGMGWIKAIVISCLIYGIVHASNPNASLISSSIIVLFGFMRIYGYLASQMLWLSMGMHIGWNFFQGPIFGYAASGHQQATLIQHTRISDKDWLSGGEFGPEGSILIIPIILLALYAMKSYTHNRQKISINSQDKNLKNQAEVQPFS